MTTHPPRLSYKLERLPLFQLVFVLLFFNLVTLVFSATDQNSKYVTLRSSTGQVTTFIAGTDDDEDGIDNELEVNGFTYDPISGLQPWDGDPDKTYYKTDPRRWSTDGDPYSDYMEVSGVNMTAGVSRPYNDPLVAARPVISVYLENYDVIPIATISDSEGKEVSDSYTNSTTNEDELGGSIGVEAKLNPLELVSVEVKVNYSHTWSRTSSSTVDNTFNWNKTRTSDPSKAAKIKLRAYMTNRGSAPALNVEPTFNLELGGKTIATITPNQTANILTPKGTPNERYPQVGAIVIEKDDSGDDIVVTLEELKALQRGVPLSLVVTQVNAEVIRWDKVNENWESSISWTSFENEIAPVAVNVLADLGNGENYEFQIFAGTDYWDPEYTFQQVLARVFEMDDRGRSINGRTYPDMWYVSSNSQKALDEWANIGYPQNLLNMRVHKNTRFMMLSPGPEPGPSIQAATYSPDMQTVFVYATPIGGFPIQDVRAMVPIDGVNYEIELTKPQGSAFYINPEPLFAAAQPGGSALAVDARGDTRTAPLMPPALNQDCQDIKNTLGLLSNGEYLVYVDGDENKPALCQCEFVSEDGAILDKAFTTFWFEDSDFSGRTIQFVSKDIGFAGGWGIRKTTDGGQTWELLNKPDVFTGSFSVTGMSWLNENLGFATSYQWIVKTEDGGQTWTDKKLLAGGQVLFDISFYDELHGAAVGSDRSIFTTVDGGASWQRRTSLASDRFVVFRAVQQVSENRIIVAGDNTIHVSNNNGSTWTEKRTSRMQGVNFVSPDTGWVVGLNGAILHTTDGGVNWIQQSTGVSSLLEDVHFLNSKRGAAVGRGPQVILNTTDGGATWTEQPAFAAGGSFEDVFFTDENHGFIVGESTALFTESGGGAMVADPNYIIPGESETNDLSPQNLLVYYGRPSSINSAFTVDGAAKEFSIYQYVILGDGLQSTEHGDHNNTIKIINHSKMNRTKVFGSIDLGVSTQNLPMEEIKSRVDAWKSMGVAGIFLDDFGYDYGVNRSRQNEAVDYVHSSGLRVIANAWNPDDVFGDEVDANYNPSGSATTLNASDFYFSESYQVKKGNYADAAEWRLKADKLRAFQDEFKFHILSTTTSDDADNYDESKFFYAWYSALLDGHEAIGWGRHSYSSDDAAAPFHERPEIQPGGWYLSDVIWAENVASRQTDRGQIVINTSTFQYDFASGATFVERIDHEIPEQFSLKQNFPNPFNPTTTIEYTLDRQDHVKVSIYDILGRELMTLVDEAQQSGTYRLQINASSWPAGMYFYRLSAGRQFDEIKKMMLVK